MHILWVKVGGLWPLNTGGRLRSFHILKELARRHRVTVLTTHGPGDDPDGLAAQIPEAHVVSVPHASAKQGSARFALALARSWLSPRPVELLRWSVPELRRTTEGQLAQGAADVCVADFLTSIPNVPFGGAVPVVLFEHNVEHVIWKRLHDTERGALRRLLLALEWRKVRRSESRACAEAALTLSVSDVDERSLRALAGGARVETIPTGVDAQFFRPLPVPEVRGHLVFSGSMDWYPNEDGILNFLERAWPEIRQHVPDATLTVAGRNPRPRLRRAAAAAGGVKLTGTVDDIRPFVARGALYVAPLRVGGGTRLKLFEALAMGKAIVATRVAAEGLPIVPGEHYVAADRPADFAAAVVALLADRRRRDALGAAGRRLVEERFSWPCVTDVVEGHLARVVRESALRKAGAAGRLACPTPGRLQEQR
ncbi:MAG: glycosyltransferase [Solirubrobacterales bacterium]